MLLRTHLATSAGHVFSPDWASPEQKAGGGLTLASDIYSFGVHPLLLVSWYMCIIRLPSMLAFGAPESTFGSSAITASGDS